MKRFVTILAAGALAACLGIVGPLWAEPASTSAKNTSVASTGCLDEAGSAIGTVAFTAPTQLWPPNHRYRAVRLVATATDPADTVALSTSGTHDEYLPDGAEARGAGGTTHDVTPPSAADGPLLGSAGITHQLRSERSGVGDGRTYTITFEATFTDDLDTGYGQQTCTGTFDVSAPHDLKGMLSW